MEKDHRSGALGDCLGWRYLSGQPVACHFVTEQLDERNDSIAAFIRLPVLVSTIPAMIVSHMLNGIRMRVAFALATDWAIVAVTSPSMASVMMIPTGPIIISAVLQATTTAFSPVAP